MKNVISREYVQLEKDGEMFSTVPYELFSVPPGEYLVLNSALIYQDEIGGELTKLNPGQTLTVEAPKPKRKKKD